jgi:hypothetical protein
MNTRSLAITLCLVMLSPVCLAQSATGHVDIILSAQPFVGQTYSFSAIVHPNGGVAGQFEFLFVNDGGSARVHGSVDCVTIFGNRARIGGTVRHSSDETVFSVGQHFIWNVTDNGEGNNDSPDTGSPLLGLPSSVPPDPFCLAGGFIGEFPSQNGNVQVRP